MIILIGGEKGGTGKTTVAVNLAALWASAGKNVVVVDTDKQQSAFGWGQVRKSIEVPKGKFPHVEIIPSFGQVQDVVVELSKNYDMVIIDASGRDSVEMRSAMTVADKFYTPVRASQYDLATLERLHNIVIEAVKLNKTLKSRVLVNCASTNPKVNDTRDAVEYVSYFYCFKVAPLLRERSAFKKTGHTGLGVHELPPREYNKLAVQELTDLAEEICDV